MSKNKRLIGKSSVETLTTIERAVELAIFIFDGKAFTTSEVARQLNIPWSSAKYLIEIASRRMSISENERGIYRLEK